MVEISAAVVKELRDKTGAGMMDCKKALTECGGDFDKAIESLRKQGIIKAEKKAGRSVKEGLIRISIKGGAAAVAEVMCETDFVAKNEKFQKFVEDLASKAADMPDTGDLSQKAQEAGKAEITGLIAVIGENMQIRRVTRWAGDGVFGSYLHMGGKIGVLVEVEGKPTETALKDICMHVAAFSPKYVRPEDIPAAIIEKEKEIGASQVEGNKPKEIVEKIVVGKLNKWFSDVCLVRQPWLRDDKVSVEKANPGVKIRRFLRWEVGEEV